MTPAAYRDRLVEEIAACPLHSYGFYSEDMDIRNAVVYGASSFFVFNLK